MTIQHHVLETKAANEYGGRVVSAHTIQCDTCGIYDVAKSDAILAHKMVYFGWAQRGTQHTCPACCGLQLGLERGRAEVADDENPPIARGLGGCAAKGA